MNRSVKIQRDQQNVTACLDVKRLDVTRKFCVSSEWRFSK